MAREPSNRQQQLRQRVAQLAARMMAEDGISDYSVAKRKAARQLGMEDVHCLPGNAEIESELRLHQEMFQGEEHTASLRQLRQDALATMQMLERFDPHLVGAVLDGTAGRHAETDVHLYADSDKEVEIFLLNLKIPYSTAERSHHFGGERRKIPVLTLEGPNGPIRLSIFGPDEIRSTSRNQEGPATRARAPALQALLDTNG
jgi:hypothetical protein